jgi:ribonuclease P protein component
VNSSVTSNRFRFSRASRLLKPSEFQAVFDARKACRGQWLTVHRAGAVVEAEIPEQIATNPSASRLGLIVAKRLVPAAARRNLIRRVLREYFRTTRNVFPAGDWIIRLHESPFPSPARVRKGVPIPTRLQVVAGLRTDLAQILKRVAGQRVAKGSADGA